MEEVPHEDALEAALVSILGRGDVDPSASFQDLAFDSMQIIEFIVSAETSFGVEFPDALLTPERLQSPANVWREAQRLSAGTKSA